MYECVLCVCCALSERVVNVCVCVLCDYRIHRRHLWSKSILDMILNNLMVRLLSVELWGMWSISSLMLQTGPLWSRVVTLDRVLSMDQINLWHLNSVQTNDMLEWINRNRTVLSFNCVNKWLMFYWILVIHRNTWKHLTLLTYAKLNC